MLIKSFSFNGISGVLERGTPLVSLMRAVYRRAIIKLFPDFRDLILSVEGKGTLSREEFEAALDMLDDDSRTIYTTLSDFIHNVAFVRECQGTPFPWPKRGEMPSIDLVREMLGYFLVDGADLMDAIRTALLELHESLAPPEQQAIPPEMEASVDPNSLRPTEFLNGEFVLSHEEL